MKKICITYHMSKPGETAETCIILPMEDKIAEDILERGEDSEHLHPMMLGEVYRALKAISAMQGYEYDEVVHTAIQSVK